ncbi:hypothetical protein KQI65_00170 [bacterium]|nr:hypothetical protein [bacterium]
MQSNRILTVFQSRIITRTLFVLALLHVIIVVVYARVFSTDAAMLMTMSDMLRQGVLPATQLHDTNPPMVVYLGYIPLLLRDLLGLSLMHATHAATVLYLGLTGLLSIYALRKLTGSESGTTALYLFSGVWMYLAVLNVHENDFGQREQLIFTAIIPYVFLRLLSLRSIPISRAVMTVSALLLAVAMLMKPMYGLAPFAVELLILWRSGGMRKYGKTLLLPALTLLWSVALLLAIRPLWHYYTEIFPLMLDFHRTLGFRIKVELFELVQQPHFQFALAVLTLALLLRTALRKSNLALLLDAIMLLYPAFVLAMLSQGKGWNYHILPMRMTMWLIVPFVLYALAVVSGKGRQVSRSALNTSLAVMFVLQLGLYPDLPGTLRAGWPEPPRTALSEAIRTHTLADDCVVAFSREVPTHFPDITYSGRRYGSRYYWSYPVTMCYSGQHDARPIAGREWYEAKYYRAMLEDIHKNKPAILLIDVQKGRWKFPPGFNLKTWLDHKGFFEGEGKHYHEVQYFPENGMVMYVRNMDSGFVPLAPPSGALRNYAGTSY